MQQRRLGPFIVSAIGAGMHEPVARIWRHAAGGGVATWLQQKCGSKTRSESTIDSPDCPFLALLALSSIGLTYLPGGDHELPL